MYYSRPFLRPYVGSFSGKKGVGSKLAQRRKVEGGTMGRGHRTASEEFEV